MSPPGEVSPASLPDRAAKPAVSVVMATYNRSNIIIWPIRSLLAQTFRDWELLVVGDACTDDSEAVVASFADPRIRFHNRAENFGEQSEPNNEGVRRARGDFLAFLNHDDLWLPEHLATCLQALEQGGDDLVFTAALSYGADLQRPRIRGATTWAERYHSSLSVPASLWVMRRELWQRVGEWRPARSLRTMPSQDWLLRAQRMGARMRPLRTLTAVIVPSGARRNSYRDREQAPHEWLAPRLSHPDFVRDAVLQAVIGWEDRRLRSGAGWLLLQSLHSLLGQVLAWLGVAPSRPIFWIEQWRRGALIRRLRRIRGLDD